MDTILAKPAAGRRRRRYSAEFKASVIEAARKLGISPAAVALANGLNANLLRKWVSATETVIGDGVSTAAAVPFVPLQIAPEAPVADIRVEVSVARCR